MDRSVFRVEACLRFVGVALLLGIHATLLAYSATVHSPTQLEPAFLASGLSHWRLARFELYRVNPPLVRMVSALPALFIGCETDWSRFHEGPGSRAEFPVGEDFITANGPSSIRLVIYARWACIPFNLVGAYFVYRWARELYFSTAAGFLSMIIYIFEPNLLAHGELITPDGACTSSGILAGYTFWRWLKQPDWAGAFLSGAALGVAELCKMSWLILFGLWPLLWLMWRMTGTANTRNYGSRAQLPQGVEDPNSLAANQRLTGCFASAPSVAKLFGILLVACYIINVGYAFDGFGTSLKDFRFVSAMLTRQEHGNKIDNRFRDTWLGDVPVPLPKQYVLGMDSQKKDLEEFAPRSYLRGECKHGGWWYYYVYGLLMKIPCGTLGLLLLALVGQVIYRARRGFLRDRLVLLVPAIALLAIASLQTESNIHLRYVLPALGILTVFAGSCWGSFARRAWVSRSTAAGLVAYSVVSTFLVYPNHLAYFNEFAGGPKNGYKQLLGSNLDWGQDLLYVREWARRNGCVVTEIRGSVMRRKVIAAMLPELGAKTNDVHRVAVVSPNVLIGGRETFPPRGTMLTPSLWIERQ